MKYALLLLLLACDKTPVTSAQVQEKFTETDAIPMSTGGSGGGITYRPRTNYVLVSAELTVCRVSRQTFIAARVGERAACKWREP